MVQSAEAIAAFFLFLLFLVILAIVIGLNYIRQNHKSQQRYYEEPATVYVT